MKGLRYPVGRVADIQYPMFSVTHYIEAIDRIRFVIAEGPFAREETVTIHVIELGDNQFLVNWQEKDIDRRQPAGLRR
jgi:hypothetical protein